MTIDKAQLQKHSLANYQYLFPYYEFKKINNINKFPKESPLRLQHLNEINMYKNKNNKMHIFHHNTSLSN